MSPRIGKPPGQSGLPPVPADAPDPLEAEAEAKVKPARGRRGRATGKLDRFEAGGKAGASPAAEGRVLPAAARTAAARMKFNDVEMAALAAVLVDIVRRHRAASRAERARLFARAIFKLEQKRLHGLFSGLGEAEAEALSAAIGDFIEGSPIFGQLIDDVTEGAAALEPT